MHTRSKDYPEARPGGAQAEQISAADYRETFLQTAHGQRVLADLAMKSGFYTVRPIDVSDAVLRDDQGQRRLFSVILRYLELTPQEAKALAEAARVERLSTYREGEE